MGSDKPKYDLKKITKLLLDSSGWRITDLAYDGAVQLGYMDDESIIEVIKNIQEDDYHKTLSAYNMPGLFQDVYRVNDCDNLIYIKLQLTKNENKVVIVQFKKK